MQRAPQVEERYGGDVDIFANVASRAYTDVQHVVAHIRIVADLEGDATPQVIVHI